MANNCNLGFEHRFAFGANPHTFSGSSQRFEVVSSTVKKQGEVLDAAGLLGARTRREDRTRYGLNRVAGQIVLEPSPRMFDFFLPYILGAAESTDTFNVADSLPGFDMLHDPFGTGSNATKFAELYVNRMSLRFAAGLLRLTLDVVGKTATSGQTYTSAALGSTASVDTPYVFYDTSAGFLLYGHTTAMEIEEGELIIDNLLDVKFRNSRTATSIRATDSIITMITNIPLTSGNWTDFYGDIAAGDGTLAIANGTVTTTFTMFNMKIADAGPSVTGKEEVPLILTGNARSDASDPNIRATVVGGSL
jgi:hypothetical protein